MDLPTHARTLARCNIWTNRRLYELCARLPDEQRKRDAAAQRWKRSASLASSRSFRK